PRQTDTEVLISSPPPPVLDELLQRREIPFRSKTKLAIRFDISKDPRHEEYRVQRWDATKRRYVPIPLNEEWHKPVSPDTVVKKMLLHIHDHVQVNLFRPNGLWLQDVFRGIYDMYDRLLSAEDLVEHISPTQTRWIWYWRLGYKHIDLLQGNVFFAELEHIMFERWNVRVVQDLTDELRYERDGASVA
ncbi:hypothetical protein CPB85DRAFT_1347487, partial [Mucidula mucida]